MTLKTLFSCTTEAEMPTNLNNQPTNPCTNSSQWHFQRQHQTLSAALQSFQINVCSMLSHRLTFALLLLCVSGLYKHSYLRRQPQVPSFKITKWRSVLVPLNDITKRKTVCGNSERQDWKGKVQHHVKINRKLAQKSKLYKKQRSDIMQNFLRLLFF